MEPTTIKPVTVGGWYERTDGSVAEIAWVDGRQQVRRAVASWAEVPSREQDHERIMRELVES